MQCEMEMLESRLQLSAAVASGATLSSSGVLSVVGERAAANTIGVKLSSDGTQIETAIGSDTAGFALAAAGGVRAARLQTREQYFPPPYRILEGQTSK